MAATVATLVARYARMATGHAGARHLAKALEIYHADNGFYPSEAQGLRALVSPPETEPIPKAYREGGYVEARALVDPWGHPYLYRQPGSRNPGGFDIWTQGADGAPGGEGLDADFGNFAP